MKLLSEQASNLKSWLNAGKTCQVDFHRANARENETKRKLLFVLTWKKCTKEFVDDDLLIKYSDAILSLISFHLIKQLIQFLNQTGVLNTK
jgi:hypothetical protein